MSRLGGTLVITTAILGLAVSLGGRGAGSASLVREARAQEHPQRAGCPEGLEGRTAEETIREHVALLQAGNLDQAMCDFDENARVILPGQVIQGLDNIKAGLGGVGSLLGGAVPQVQTLTTARSVVLLTFTAIGNPCTIPDGADTYIVERGHIAIQTVHDTLHSAPNATCPVGAL